MKWGPIIQRDPSEASCSWRMPSPKSWRSRSLAAVGGLIGSSLPSCLVSFQHRSSRCLLRACFRCRDLWRLAEDTAGVASSSWAPIWRRILQRSWWRITDSGNALEHHDRQEISWGAPYRWKWRIWSSAGPVARKTVWSAWQSNLHKLNAFSNPWLASERGRQLQSLKSSYLCFLLHLPVSYAFDALHFPRSSAAGRLWLLA